MTTPNYTTDTPYKPCTCSGWIDTRTPEERERARKKELLYSIAEHFDELSTLIREAVETFE